MLSPKAHKFGNRFVTQVLQDSYHKGLIERHARFLHVIINLIQKLIQRKARALHQTLHNVAPQVFARMPAAAAFPGFIMQRTDDVLPIIRIINNAANGDLTALHQLATFDIERMFTMLPHHIIRAQVNALVQELWAAERHDPIAPATDHLRVYTGKTTNHHEWVDDPNGFVPPRPFYGTAQPHGTYVVYTEPIAQADLAWILDNSYVRIGDKVYKQQQGVPMGIDDAPDLTTLTLLFQELRFFDRLHAAITARQLTTVQMQELLDMVYTHGRYLDDILTGKINTFLANCNNNIINPANNLAGIYDLVTPQHPLGLTITASGSLQPPHAGTTIADLQCVFLDIKLIVERRVIRGGAQQPTVIRHLIQSVLYQKKESDAYRRQNIVPTRWPDIDSAISTSTKYAGFTSQFIRFGRLITVYKGRPGAFVEAVAELILEFTLGKGYSLHRLLSMLRHLCNTRVRQLHTTTALVPGCGYPGFTSSIDLNNDIYRIVRDATWHARNPHQPPYVGPPPAWRP